MRLNFGEIFHTMSKDKKMDGLVNIPSDSSLWPEAWSAVSYKSYSFFPTVALPKPISKDFSNTDLVKRISKRDFSGSLGQISLQELSNILFFSCGETRKSIDDKKNKRAQPSAGERYPVEVYVLSFTTSENGLLKKCYHYNVKEHVLKQLWDFPIKNKKEVNKYFAYEWSQEAACAIVLTGVPSRTCMKYGERGYRYMYLEAGAILNNIQNQAMLAGIKSVAMGGINDIEVEELLDLDGVQESVIIGILLGK
jgi:SagB-type dehydrogenase family enzyme